MEPKRPHHRGVVAAGQRFAKLPHRRKRSEGRNVLFTSLQQANTRSEIFEIKKIMAAGGAVVAGADPHFQHELTCY